MSQTSATGAGASVVPGWYSDPNDPGQLRWWSGVAWTEHVSPAIPQAPSPSPSAPVSGGDSVLASVGLPGGTTQGYPGLAAEQQSTLPSRRELRESQAETGAPVRQSFLEQNGYPSVPSPAVQPERSAHPQDIFPKEFLGATEPVLPSQQNVWNVAGEAEPSVPERQVVGNQPVQPAWPVQDAWNIQDSQPVRGVQPTQQNDASAQNVWPVQDAWPLQTTEQPVVPQEIPQNRWNLPVEPTAVAGPTTQNAWNQPVNPAPTSPQQSATPATDGIEVLFGSVASVPTHTVSTQAVPTQAMPTTPAIPTQAAVPIQNAVRQQTAVPAQLWLQEPASVPSSLPFHATSPVQVGTPASLSTPASPMNPSQNSFPSGGSLGQWGLTPRGGDYSSVGRKSENVSQSRRQIVESSSTFWVWVIAISPILTAGGIGYVLKTSGASLSTWMLPAAIVAPYVLILLLAIADRSSLGQLGHEEPASWGWAALTAPIYLLVRASATRRETGTGSGPAVTWFVSVVVAVIGFIGYGLITGQALVAGLPT